MERYYEINTPAVISEPMEGELVVINLDNGCYYCLNKTATQFLNYLEQGGSLNEILSHMAGCYGCGDSTILEDFTGFVESLVEEQLIREAKSVPTKVIPLKEAQGESYLKPNFEKYSDMQEMLLLDPIHEVSDDGWPNQKKK
jgi:hypothetical protein